MLPASRVQCPRGDRDLQPDFKGMEGRDIQIGTQFPAGDSLEDEPAHRLRSRNQHSAAERAQQRGLTAPMGQTGGQQRHEILPVD